MLLDRIGKELLILDGGMGTLLQEKGLEPGELPEIWNIEKKEAIIDIHRQYFLAGSDIVLTNTFGANALKFQEGNYSLEDIVTVAIDNVRMGAKLALPRDKKYYVAFDVGPTGKLLKPMGDLEFEKAIETFSMVMSYAEKAGADVIHIETMSDTYEVKAAVLAAKESTNLPVFVTMIFDEKGKLLTGGDIACVVAMLEGLKVDALGINCGLGPVQMIPLIEELASYTSLPIIVKPNAGLPQQKDGMTFYDVAPTEFAMTMQTIVKKGASIIGGCCGTTPNHIKAMVTACESENVITNIPKTHTLVSSYGTSIEIGDKPIIVGERINPTGKKRFKEALKNNDLDYILKEGITQQEKGAHILDVNVGLPDIDEVSMMKEVITRLQSITSLPLQIDTVNNKAMEEAMRVYNGKPMINSVNGKEESMHAVFPLIKKYGGVVVGLTIDESGIPETVEGRVAIAKKIINVAQTYGIDKKDIIIDVLAMTISSEPQGALITLESLVRVKEELGVKTILGVSNISFGLPNRPIINASFYTMALLKGLSAAIINPSSQEMMKSYDSYCALMNYDKNCQQYIANYSNIVPEKKSFEGDTSITLKMAIEKGLKEEAYQGTVQLLENSKPLDIINEHLIPALDNVGKGFETGTVFLPQLLMSAEAAKAAFAIIKEKLASEGIAEKKKVKVILATVKGDIHDIGKNIVKVLLENYSFDVIDLGKDVAPEVIVQTSLEQNVQLVGLSALMTTTVVSMEQTIQLLNEKNPTCKVMVGGAVLNQEYANAIGADFYGKDAMQSVYYAQKIMKPDNV